MKKCLLFLTACLAFDFAFAQCPSTIILSSQQEVNNFINDYDHCIEIDTLILDDGEDIDITDISNLRNIKKVKLLRITRLKSLLSLKGLDSLQEVRELYYSANSLNASNSEFTSLKTIGKISHYFSNGDEDLSIYRNVESINELRIQYDGYLTGLYKLNDVSSTKIVILDNKNENNFSFLIPSNSSQIKELHIRNCEKLNLYGLNEIDSIGLLQIFSSKIKGVTHISEIGKIPELSLLNNEYDSPVIFNNIDNTKVLSIRGFNELISLDEIFPKLESVSVILSIFDNENLSDISLLNDFKLPSKDEILFYDTGIRISIVGNPNLSMCNINYLCKAINTYPDSILIENNAERCNESSLFEDCISSAVHEHQENSVIYPNPVEDILTVSSNLNDFNFHIYNNLGEMVREGKVVNNQVDFTTIQTGTYLIKFSKGFIKKAFRIIKQASF